MHGVVWWDALLQIKIVVGELGHDMVGAGSAGPGGVLQGVADHDLGFTGS